ncbi:MAG: phage tail tape measure protein, partial [Nanoarchaeota archaeon]
ERQTLINGVLQKTSGSLKDVTSQFRVQNIEIEKAGKSILSLTGQASQLSTNFSKVSDVNSKFSKELKKFGDATTVINSGVTNVSGNITKLSSVIQTTDGKFIKLTETINKTPEGIQKISRSATEVSDKYIKLTKVQDDVKNSFSQLSTNFSRVSDVSRKFSKELSNFGNISRVLGQNINEISGNTSRAGIIVQTTSGKFIQLKESVTKLADGTQVVKRGMKDVTDQFIKGNIEAEKGGKVFSNLADNVKQLAGRALLTIPIWIALRASITGVFQGISGGVKDLVAFDLALQKIRNNLQGTPEQVASDFKKIRNSITQASKESGISTEELAAAVKQFATIGFNANESLQGGLAASKLSIALFGDAG